MPEIIVKYEDKVIERIVTEKRRLSIGRTNDNDIMLENRGISRRHAIIEFSENAAVVIDNESLNGTFVNKRRVQEEMLNDNDIITIGKYSLEYHADATARGEDHANFDGTMVLNTKQQKELLDGDRKDRQLVKKHGCSLLIGLENTDFSEFSLDREVTTIGKAKFVHVRAKGFWLSGIQAKIAREGEDIFVVNLGKEGKTKVNGEVVSRAVLRNGDIVTIGKTSFKFVQGKA
jgi:pSer/pThr/pTyr-binding forkhead associated (FHA) protein